MIKRSLVLLWCSFHGLVSIATEYHVNNRIEISTQIGTIDQPFKTISQASAVMTAGDICYINEGVYREEITPQNSGASGTPITYSNYMDDKVVITATKAVSEWKEI